MRELQQYTYTIPANGSVQIPAANDNFIIQAATGPLAIRGDTFGRMRGMVAGQGLKMVQFNRLELFDESGAPNTVTLLMTPAEFVNQIFSGSVSVVGPVALDATALAALAALSTVSLSPATLAALESVDLNPATLAALESVDLNPATIYALRVPHTFVSNFVDATAMGAGAVQQVFAPAANVNGAQIMSASWAGVNASVPCEHNALIANSAAPGGYSGRVIAQCRVDYNVGGGTGYGLTLERPIVVPAGNGLWFYCQSAESRGARSVLYTLL